MKKSLIIVLSLFLTGTMYAQDAKEWFKSNVDTSSVGIELDKANEFLKAKKQKKDPIVAIISAGADIEHEALIKSLWVNPKEKVDGKDDDKNGYVDDVNGWNFVSSPDGTQMLEVTPDYGDREWLRLKDKYGDLLSEDNVFFTVNDDGTRKIVGKPENMEEYRYYKMLLDRQLSPLCGYYGGYQYSLLTKNYMKEWDRILAGKFPGKSRKEIGMDAFKEYVVPTYVEGDTASAIAITMVGLYIQLMDHYYSKADSKKTWEDVYNYYMDEQVPKSKKSYEELLAKSAKDERKKIVGDNYLDLTDTKYGSPQLLTTQSLYGTLLAGIVTGICPNTKLMTLVALPGKGYPYLKDIVLSIRYAVDHGADVIILSTQSNFYPVEQKKWLADVIHYADEKGVLVVAPAAESSSDLNKTAYFPSPDMDERFHLNNLMVVANSSQDGNPAKASNYGNGKLDIYAPGISIYSTAPGDLYRTVNSAGLGAGVTAGVAALIKAYFPKLTGDQIRTLIIENPTDRKGIEVEKGIEVDGQPSQDLFLFEQLCTAGGIVNANNAVRAADEIK